MNPAFDILRRSLLTTVAGQVLVLRDPRRPGETLGGLPVTLADEHLPIVVILATGDRLVCFLTAVGVDLGVRVVEDGPAFVELHGVTVTIVVHLAAPIQIVHSRAIAAISTIAAVVSVVQNRLAAGHRALDHFPELV